MENGFVRVLDTRVAPDGIVPAHTHRWPNTLYILSWSDFMRRDGAGDVTLESRGAGTAFEGQALWSGPSGSHTLENVGDRELRATGIGVKHG